MIRAKYRLAFSSSKPLSLQSLKFRHAIKSNPVCVLGFMSLPWSWIVCRAACRRLCRKRESDRALACRTPARSSGTRRRCVLSSSKARDAPRCWTIAISETGKTGQTLLSGPGELRVTAKYASLYNRSRLEVSRRLILLHENWDLTDPRSPYFQ